MRAAGSPAQGMPVGATGALLAVVFFALAQSWAGQSPDVQVATLASVALLTADLGLGIGTGRLATTLTGTGPRGWPSVAVVSATAAVLLGWGPGAELLHPGMAPLTAAFAALACAAVGGWLGLALPPTGAGSLPRACRPDEPTIELQLLAGCRPDPRPDRRFGHSRRRVPVRNESLSRAAASGPDILDSRG